MEILDFQHVRFLHVRSKLFSQKRVLLHEHLILHEGAARAWVCHGRIFSVTELPARLHDCVHVPNCMTTYGQPVNYTFSWESNDDEKKMFLRESVTTPKNMGVNSSTL